MDRNKDDAQRPRVNTVESILAGFSTLPSTMNDVDKVLGPNRLNNFAKMLKEIDNHADPRMPSFNGNVLETKKKDFIWLQFAAAGQELMLAWNLVRLAAPAAARRSARVALEHLSMGVLEGIPIDVIRENWKELPKKKVPLWMMTLPPSTFDKSASNIPLIPSNKFPHILQAVLPTFPGWDSEMAQQLGDYVRSHLHPFAHGSANALAYMISGTSVENPIMGNVFDFQHPEIYTELADELIYIAAMFQNILIGANSYLTRQGQ